MLFFKRKGFGGEEQQLAVCSLQFGTVISGYLVLFLKNIFETCFFEHRMDEVSPPMVMYGFLPDEVASR